MAERDPRLALLLALADDELILGHRHSEWTGWAPNIEEDLAFSSIAQDEMAHARLLYTLAASAGLTDRSYRRQEAYAGVGARQKRVSREFARAGVRIDRSRPPAAGSPRARVPDA